MLVKLWAVGRSGFGGINEESIKITSVKNQTKASIFLGHTEDTKVARFVGNLPEADHTAMMPLADKRNILRTIVP